MQTHCRLLIFVYVPSWSCLADILQPNRSVVPSLYNADYGTNIFIDDYVVDVFHPFFHTFPFSLAGQLTMSKFSLIQREAFP